MADALDAIPPACASGDDAAIAAAFRLFKKNKSELLLAWSQLEKYATRAARSTIPGPKITEREVRQVGPVVAWRDRAVQGAFKVSSGTIKLHVAETRAEADAFIDAELGAQGFTWGYRPPAGEPQTTFEHRQERARLIAAGDAAAFVAYLERYSRASLLQFNRDLQAMAGRAWSTEDVLIQLVTDRATADFTRAALEQLSTPTEYAVWFALEKGADAIAATLVPKLGGGFDDVAPPRTETLLAAAVRHGANASIDALLEKGANPNACAALIVGDRDGAGPLVNALRAANVSLVKKLMAAGGDANAKTASGRTLREFATALGNAEVLAALGA